MPTTSNFGWTTPADTDLVKDGALAIRTLGNGIDTSFLDLKGGTTDQVLAKNSNTDLDFKWVAQDDSNAIQNAIVDAKGDLISATAADTPARLAVGANGTVLTADSTEATGLKWATPSSGGFTSLASGSLSGSAVTISSISSAYTDLYLIINAPDQSVLIDDDSGNNFDGYVLEIAGNNAAINTVSQVNTGNIYPSYNGVGVSQVQIICYIYNYANTTARKLYNLLASGGNNCDSAQWASRSTAAVANLSINAAAGSFGAGTYTLYGVK